MTLCVLFDADGRQNFDFVSASFSRITSLFDGRATVVPMLHNATWDLPGAIHLNDADIFDAFPHRKGRTIIPGNEDLKIIAAVERLPEYSNFLRIEYDVFPTPLAFQRVGELCELAESGMFAASYLRTRAEGPDWMWWPGVKAPGDAPFPDDKMFAAFFPLLTFNRALVDFTKARLMEGWVGHVEALMPTFAAAMGNRLVCLARAPYDLVRAGEFMAVPTLPPGAVPQGCFVHPVKSNQGQPATGNAMISAIRAFFIVSIARFLDQIGNVVSLPLLAGI